GAIVILNAADYEKEILRQLSDDEFYKRHRKDPTNQFKSLIHDKLSTFLNEGEITKTEYEYMKVDCPTTPVTCALPKIHKSMTPPISGRPIVSSNGSLTEYLYLCRLFCETLGDLPPHGGLEALKFYLNERPPNALPSTNCIVDLAELVLTANNFLFRGGFFLQTKGTVMGSTMAPNYANLYLGMLEKQVMLNPDLNPFLSNILLILRYLDDIFVIYTGTQGELLEFHAYLNSMNEHLHFTINYDLSPIRFLDVMVIKDKTSLSTDLYRKPTDRNTLLRGDSFHPSPLIKSLPISQFSRIRRICSSDASYQKQTTDLTQRFKERVYKDNWIKHANDCFEGLTQLESLQPKVKEKAEHVPSCFTQYSPLGKAFKDIIRKH
ncbi:unnamed protein product, partial [Coregonus sp. 'balchen']